MQRIVINKRLELGKTPKEGAAEGGSPGTEAKKVAPGRSNRTGAGRLLTHYLPDQVCPASCSKYHSEMSFQKPFTFQAVY